MQVINRGEISDVDGFILSFDEYYRYKKLLEVLEVVKREKRDYDLVYGE